MRKELFYFASTDLLVRVEIDEQQNSVIYHTHRVTNYSERSIVEKYLAEKVLSVGDIYKNTVITFATVDNTLLNDYKKVQQSIPGNSSATLKQDLKKKEDEINTEIVRVCTAANRDYWFNKLGDILRDRNENHSDDKDWRSNELAEAVCEYNQTVKKENRITLENLIKKTT